MNKINIQKETGFPVQKKTFDFMRDAYTSAIEHLCKIHGNNLILHGVEKAGTQRTAGAIVVNGELIPFEQSNDNANIKIFETTEPVIYQGGEQFDAYITRIAKCDSSGNINLANLKRVASVPINTDANNILRSNAEKQMAWGKVNLATDVTGVLPMTNGGTGRNLKLDWDIRAQMNETDRMNTTSVSSAIVLGSPYTGNTYRCHIVYLCAYIFGISGNFGPFTFDLPLAIKLPDGIFTSGSSMRIPFDIYIYEYSSGNTFSGIAGISSDSKLIIKSSTGSGYFGSACLVCVKGMYLTIN
jgi:hypothetical protein